MDQNNLQQTLTSASSTVSKLDPKNVTPENKKVLEDMKKTLQGISASLNSNPTGPVSSSTPIINNNITSATDAAYNTTKTTTPTPTKNQKILMDYYGLGLDDISSSFKDPVSLAKEAKAILDAEAAKKGAEDVAETQRKQVEATAREQRAKQDVELARTLDTIKKKKEGTMTQMKAQSYAANPYAATSSSVNDNQARVDSIYTGLEQRADEAFQLAREALNRGETDSYNQIMEGLNTAIAKADTDAQAVLSGLAGQRLQAEEFEFNKQKTAQDDFRYLATTFGSSPQLATDIDSYLTTGTAPAALAPFIETGKLAGYTPEESVSIMRYGTDQSRKQQSLEDYRNQQLINSQDRQTNAQMTMAKMQQLGGVSQSLIASGVKPGSKEYTLSMVAATSGGTPISPTRQEKYDSIQTMAGSLNDLKEAVNKVAEDSIVKSAIISNMGRTVSSMSDKDISILTAKINSLAPLLGKEVFGHTGVLSNQDMVGILSAMPTADVTSDVRTALYNSLVKRATESMYATVMTDVNQGKDVSLWAPYIQEIADSISPIEEKNVETPGDIETIFGKYNIKL